MIIAMKHLAPGELRRGTRIALFATVLLAAAGGVTPATAQAGGFCAAGSFCQATFDVGTFWVIGPCSLSSPSTTGGCLVIRFEPVPGSGEPLKVCGLHGCGPRSIVQDGAPTNALEQEARQQIAALRAVQDGTLNIYWSRGQIRAYMFLRLMGMAFAQPGTLSPQDQQVADYYTAAINRERVTVAQAALDLYNVWNGNPCGFQVPVGDPNAYLSQPTVAGSLTAPCLVPPNSPACLVGACRPDPPTAEQFTAWAVGKTLQAQMGVWALGLQQESGIPLTDEQAQFFAAVEHAAVFGGVYEGMSYLSAIHAGVANLPAAQVTAVQSNLEALWLAALRDFAGTNFRDLVIGAVSTVFAALIADVVVNSLAATVLTAWNNVIAPAIAAAAVIAYTTWEQVNNADVKIKLEAALTDANAGHGLAHYVSDTEGRALMLDVFVKSTLPDFLTARLEDSTHGMALGSGPASASDPVFIQQANVNGSFTIEGWNGDTVFTSVRDGWFVQTRNNGPYRYVPSIDYVTGGSVQCNDAGCTFTPGRREHWRAWLNGAEFLAQRIAVEAGLGTVTHAINNCSPNMPLLPNGNVNYGNLCVLAAGIFDFALQSGDHVVLDGQARTVANVTHDSSGNVTAFSTTAPFGDMPSTVPVMVMTRADGNCLTASSLGTRVAGPDCTLNSTIWPTSGAVTIWSRPTLTVTASSTTANYGDAAPTITPSYSGFVNGDTAASLLTPPTCGTQYTAGSFPGTYQTTCLGAVDPKYTIVYVAGAVIVPYGPLTITASSATLTYGDPVPAITPSYAGEPQALLTTLPNCTTAYTRGSPPGTYTTTCSGAVADVSPISCTGAGTQLICTGGNPLFAISYAAGTVTVNPAPLAIAASSATVIYGDAVPTIAPIYNGFVNGETAASLAAQPTCTTAYMAGAGIGAYGTSCSGAATPNYSISYMPGSLTVTPKSLTVMPIDQTKTYGQTVIFAGTEFTTSGLINGDTVTNVPLTSAGASATAGVSGSPYAIFPGTAVGTGLGNYTVGYAIGRLTVNTAPLTVTASNETMIMGASVPATSPTYTGFVAGDDAASLTTQASCATTATSDSPVGVYPSTCSGASSPNYSFTYADGAVSVTYAISAVVDAPAMPVSGSTIPFRIQVMDARGTNLSSRLVTVTLATPAVSPNPGSAPQPTGTFMEAGPLYIYTLKTTDYPPGAYTLAFTVAGDPLIHSVEFVLR